MNFDKNVYTVESLTVGDHTIRYRQFVDLLYADLPANAAYQRMRLTGWSWKRRKTTCLVRKASTADILQNTVWNTVKSAERWHRSRLCAC